MTTIQLQICPLARFAISSVLTVHPRACGEHTPKIISDSSLIGSSPRVRGTLSGFIGQEHPQRFIPARAGNTLTGYLDVNGLTVHPRACGEHHKWTH